MATTIISASTRWPTGSPTTSGFGRRSAVTIPTRSWIRLRCVARSHASARTSPAPYFIVRTAISNPLRLLRALAGAVRGRGGVVCTGTPADAVEVDDHGYRVRTPGGGIVDSDRVVLCAGLGNARLGPSLGFSAPLRPQRGQNLITEKLPPLIHRPSAILRQVDEGEVQIGDSKEEVGYDEATTLDVSAGIAARAVRIYPELARVRINRSWAGLRILSPDGLPIYQQSPSHRGAFLVSCHSGITLGAAHARLLPRWLEGHSDAPDLEAFSESRFALPAA
ncbi:MAG: FAD-binding oxidoreductase [Arhodomonas sp.]|nr:FAD-binding oxidoreductase [Arhodomonas sp.]